MDASAKLLDLLQTIGCSKKDIIEHEKAVRDLDQFKTPTKKLNNVAEIVELLKPLQDDNDCKISIEYNFLRCIISVTRKLAIVFDKEKCDALTAAINLSDRIAIQNDVIEDNVAILLQVEDVFELPE